MDTKMTQCRVALNYKTFDDNTNKWRGYVLSLHLALQPYIVNRPIPGALTSNGYEVGLVLYKNCLSLFPSPAGSFNSMLIEAPSELIFGVIEEHDYKDVSFKSAHFDAIKEDTVTIKYTVTGGRRQINHKLDKDAIDELRKLKEDGAPLTEKWLRLDKLVAQKVADEMKRTAVVQDRGNGGYSLPPVPPGASGHVLNVSAGGSAEWQAVEMASKISPDHLNMDAIKEILRKEFGI